MSDSSCNHSRARMLFGLTAAFLLCSLALAGVAGSLSSGTVAHAQESQAQTGGGKGIKPEATPTPAPGSRYKQTNLTSDIPGFALIQDPLIINPWGISMTAASPFWLSNNGTSTSSLYRGDVGSLVFFKQPGMPSITIPGALPTGTVANGTSDFVVTSGSASGPARFIFSSITGNITGWNPSVPAAGSTVAQIAVSKPGHVYTGLAIGSNSGGNRLYAADFASGLIDVFDGTYAVTTTTGGFADPTIPTTPGNVYHPFNIQNIGGLLYVMYAKVGPDGKSEAGVGNGYVRRFNTDGVRDLTFGINNGALNSPWGVVIAPASFGVFGGALLVGNFGGGAPSINTFNPTTGAVLGSLKDASGAELEIDKLWALVFGNGGSGGDPNTLYFSAGTAKEEHGLFGSIKPINTFAPALVGFGAKNYTIGEGNGSIQITVTRSGDVSGAATVNYNTFDESSAGHATQKRDYEIAEGTLRFNPGETSKTFKVLLVDDSFVEGDETVNMALSNPTGADLAGFNSAELTITDNDSSPSTTNPIDGIPFFVRQQYLDFLSREPDSGGFTAWVNLLTACAPGNTSCDRVTVSQSFFLSPEFQARGYFAIRVYRAAYGRDPLYGEFMGDLSRLSGATPDETNALRAAFPGDFAQRNEFHATLDALTNAQYVDRLISNAGVTISNRDQLVADLDGMIKTRAEVLNDIVGNSNFVNNVPTFNRAFVLTEYFGYLRRDPEPTGFNAWLTFLNANPGAFRTMVNGFVNSLEYRQRFGAS
jgi:uncharacterized protein (TIGR03118 family)